MKTKILIVEHDSKDRELIQQELKKDDVNYITKTVQTETAYEKAIHTFQPDIILSNYTFPTFNGKLEGSIQVESEPGTGTTFIITLKNLKP